MSEGWTRRQILAQATIAAAVYTLDPHELCCANVEQVYQKTVKKS